MEEAEAAAKEDEFVVKEERRRSIALINIQVERIPATRENRTLTYYSSTGQVEEERARRISLLAGSVAEDEAATRIENQVQRHFIFIVSSIPLTGALMHRHAVLTVLLRKRQLNWPSR